MSKKKIAFELLVPVAQSTINNFIKEIEEHLLDQYDLKLKVKDNEEVMALLKKHLQKYLADSPQYTYAFDLFDEKDIKKIFNTEIEAAIAKTRERGAALLAEQAEKHRATAGILRMSTENLAKAEKLLKEAGIVSQVG